MKGIINPLQRDKVFRLTVYSKDRISGDVRDGVYQIDLPDFIPDINKYHMAVEECVLASEPSAVGLSNATASGNFNLRTYIVETSIAVPDSFSTSVRTNTRVLFQMCKPTPAANAIAYYYKPITTTTNGIPVIDVNMLRNKHMRITFKRCDDTNHDVDTMPNTSSWSLTLVIYPFKGG